ncbi:hypothetical protein D0C36_02530 [Mucilaginibacter conchicola]|uniref:Autotransporter domain-containing protein n=1 Tax=Mucilaginibacter conchicola TaxID=2303333 RepID=A0A372NWF1_9SPHI|nr:hypothetical protein [Mucilaginibacter conchicola]RFZ94446.1 hypothetical protein D0C36_02530 [Mucilaginibacter conchicola]
MVKPHSKDSVRNRFYASGTYLNQGGANGQGDLKSGLLNVYRSNTLNHFNFSYGALVYTGSYKRGMYDSLMNTPSKTFGGYGFNGSASVYTATRITDWRFGVDLSYIRESGQYLDFRRSVYGMPGVNASNQSHLIGLGVFTEFVTRISPSFNIGVKAFVNNTLSSPLKRDLSDETGSGHTVGSNISLGYKQYTVRLSGAFSGNFVNSASQLGLTYGF